MQEFIDSNPSLYKKALNCDFEKLRKIKTDLNDLLDNNTQDNLVKHVLKIQENIQLYNQKSYNEFLRKTEFKINKVADKLKLAKIIKCLDGMVDKTIGEVIDYADKNGIVQKDDKFSEFIEKKEYIFNRIKTIKFSEFQALFNYREDYTVFSTQHKIKGAEYDNVLIIMDNGNWKNYNYEYIFDDSSNKNNSVRQRTLKLFYVCCTRAKKNLAVYSANPSNAVLDQAKIWFGDNNVIPVNID